MATNKTNSIEKAMELAQQKTPSPLSVDMLDLVLNENDILDIEIQLRPGNKKVLYLHVNGVTVVRFLVPGTIHFDQKYKFKQN